MRILKLSYVLAIHRISPEVINTKSLHVINVSNMINDLDEHALNEAITNYAAKISAKKTRLVYYNSKLHAISFLFGNYPVDLKCPF